jgi:hypothetical protein
MNRWSLHTLLLSATALAMLAGCGSAMQPATQPALRPQAANAFMQPRTSSDDLVYVSDRWKRVVNVYSFPNGERVGKLTGFQAPTGECVDRQGNIWITDTGKVVEYAHGGSAPIGSLNADADGCAINPRNGDLALTSRYSGDVTIYKNARGTPSVYSDPAVPGYFYCTYDNAGNLFITADSTDHPLAELVKGSSTIAEIAYPRATYLGSASWDGSYLVLARSGEYNVPVVFDRVSVSGSKATIVSSLQLYGFHHKKHNEPGVQYALFNGTIIGPNHSPSREARFVNFWKYPDGGDPFKQVSEQRAVFLWGTAVSPHN